MRPSSSIYAKILLWFFLNLSILTGLFMLIVVFGTRVELESVFGRQAADRLYSTARQIVHDFTRSEPKEWPNVLSRTGDYHKVSFVMMLDDGTTISDTNVVIPSEVVKKTMTELRKFREEKNDNPPPPFEAPEKEIDQRRGMMGMGMRMLSMHRGDSAVRIFRRFYKFLFMMRTSEGFFGPSIYWSAIRIPAPFMKTGKTTPAVLLAYSDTLSGNDFFFNPYPFIIGALGIIILSILFWIPLVRHITKPLQRITKAAEDIADGRFDVKLSENRSDEIGRLARAVNHMTSRLEGYVKGQKRFLSDAAHELGSPIARIRFGLGILEEKLDGNEQKRVIDVSEDVDHLSNIVNELLSYSRAEMSAEKVKLRETRLIDIAETAIALEKPDMEKIKVDIQDDLSVMASPELLTRAVSNLIRNALKYGRKPDGSLGVIEITARKNKDRKGKVILEVRDNGPGVHPDYLERLFEPFFRPQEARERDTGGVGLGLAIVKTCVTSINGKVSARNLDPGFAVSIEMNLM